MPGIAKTARDSKVRQGWQTPIKTTKTIKNIKDRKKYKKTVKDGKDQPANIYASTENEENSDCVVKQTAICIQRG